MDTVKRFLFSYLDYMYWNYCKTNKKKQHGSGLRYSHNKEMIYLP